MGAVPITIPLGAHVGGKNGYETQRRSTYGLRPREGHFRGSLGSGPAIGQEAMLLTSPVVPSGLFFTQRFTGRNPATASSDRVSLSGSVLIAAANEVTSGVARGPSCPRMSAIGTKQTSSSTLNMSAFGGKADISDRLAYVR